MTNLAQRMGLIPSPTFEKTPSGTVKVTNTSMFTGKERTIELPITMEQVSRWKDGELLQNAFPDLTPAQREFISTGSSDDDWYEFEPPEE
jgi:hypothetical protein